MDIEQLRNDAKLKWASLPLDLQDSVSRLVRFAESSIHNGVFFNLTASDSDHDAIASLKRLARAVGHPHIRVVNGENYFELSESMVSVIVKNEAQQLALF